MLPQSGFSIRITIPTGINIAPIAVQYATFIITILQTHLTLEINHLSMVHLH